MARYDDNGSLDLTFGTGGYVMTGWMSVPPGSGVSTVQATDIELQPNGKLLVLTSLAATPSRDVRLTDHSWYSAAPFRRRCAAGSSRTSTATANTTPASRT